MRTNFFFAAARAFFAGVGLYCAAAHASTGLEVTMVDGTRLTGSNSFYLGNQAPLLPSRLLDLPIENIEPRGWLLETLHRQRDGLCGHLDEISVWLEKKDNAWLSRTGQGEHGWEEVPYWLRGYLQLAYILHDASMTAEAQIWIEGALQSQRADGDFGPAQKFPDGSRDFWANMLMLYCLETYYDHSHDSRVLDLMTKYFQFQQTVPDDKFLTHYWQRMRGGDDLYSVYWLYNHTRDPKLLELAAKIHRCTANWESKNNLPDWHNVNIAEAFREPAEHYLQTHNPAELQDTYADFREVRKRYGQVPGGMFGGDENCRPGHTDPHQAVETCGMVEQMFSDEILLQITGDCSWADNCENVAFNTYPAALMPDLRSLRYLTAPNMVVSDAANHKPGLDNGGPFLVMNPFSSRCCQHNHSMGWPALARSLWMATPDNGLCAILYSASAVQAQVGLGQQILMQEDSKYPFEDSIRFKFHADAAVQFPFYLRIPAWCHTAQVQINGEKVPAVLTPGRLARINRIWKPGDSVTLSLPMEITMQHWTNGSVSVERGPLTYSLDINERYQKRDSARTAIGDSGWQKTADPTRWPSFEIFPASPWNFGLVSSAAAAPSFAVKHHPWPKDNFPFTPENSPITLTAQMERIPSWTLDKSGLCAIIPARPVAAAEPVESETLIPMGAARLRISSFPMIDKTANSTP